MFDGDAICLTGFDASKLPVRLLSNVHDERGVVGDRCRRSTAVTVVGSARLLSISFDQLGGRLR